MEYLPCPICDEENNPIKPCSRKSEHHPVTYTFRCPRCGTRAFLPEEVYEGLLEQEKVLID